MILLFHNHFLSFKEVDALIKVDHLIDSFIHFCITEQHAGYTINFDGTCTVRFDVKDTVSAVCFHVIDGFAQRYAYVGGTTAIVTDTEHERRIERPRFVCNVSFERLYVTAITFEYATGCLFRVVWIDVQGIYRL